MREPLASGFMRGGHFTWPERERVLKKCLEKGCNMMLDGPINGTRQRRCKDCAKKHQKVYHLVYMRKQRAKAKNNNRSNTICVLLAP